MNWTAFWNGEHSIYVSRRHLERHYYAVAQSIIELIGPAARTVVDFGCGEALSADLVAARCERLYLCESAPAVIARLQARFAASPRILAPADGLAAVPDRSVDLLVMNSVVQYLTPSSFVEILSTVRGKLSPNGTLVVADILPGRASALADAASLLGFAAKEGFLLDALCGLARTTFSSYPRLRRELGLLRFDEDEILGVLTKNGFTARRLPRNLGHNQQRMAFAAEVT